MQLIKAIEPVIFLQNYLLLSPFKYTRKTNSFQVFNYRIYIFIIILLSTLVFQIQNILNLYRSKSIFIYGISITTDISMLIDNFIQSAISATMNSLSIIYIYRQVKVLNSLINLDEDINKLVSIDYSNDRKIIIFYLTTFTILVMLIAIVQCIFHFIVFGGDITNFIFEIFLTFELFYVNSKSLILASILLIVRTQIKYLKQYHQQNVQLDSKTLDIHFKLITSNRQIGKCFYYIPSGKCLSSISFGINYIYIVVWNVLNNTLKFGWAFWTFISVDTLWFICNNLVFILIVNTSVQIEMEVCYIFKVFF